MDKMGHPSTIATVLAGMDDLAYGDLRNKRLEKAYERGRLECLELCAKLHVTLPRELRDMIYDKLIPPRQRQYVLDSQVKSNNPLVVLSFFEPRARMPDPPSVRYDTWRYKEYTGQVVAPEIAERWYHNGEFVLDADDGLVTKFLTTDVWERGILPANAVKRLQVDFTPNHGDSHFGCTIDSLLGLNLLSNRNTEIVLNIKSRSIEGRSRPLKLIIADLRQTIESLRVEKGFGKIVVRQNCSFRFPHDVTAYFYGQTKEAPNQHDSHAMHV